MVPDEQPLILDTLLLDGQPTVEANLVQLDFYRSEFDRREGAASDPPIELIFELLNRVLATLRTLLRAGQLKPLAADGSYWRLDYLTDAGAELLPEEGLIRRRLGQRLFVQLHGITEATWRRLQEVSPAYSPPAWETLLLDAEALLPEIGPALVLAATTLETLIAAVLDWLAAQANLPPGLWAWINDRGDYRKEPSTAEQFDALLRSLAGTSLKDDGRLWEGFKQLRDARNSFVHDGRAVIGKNRDEVTVARARELVGRAREIAAWIEQLLPANQRRPEVGQPMQWHFERRLI